MKVSNISVNVAHLSLISFLSRNLLKESYHKLEMKEALINVMINDYSSDCSSRGCVQRRR